MDRRLDIAEIHDVMSKIQELSIRGDTITVRAKSRRVSTTTVCIVIIHVPYSVDHDTIHSKLSSWEESQHSPGLLHCQSEVSASCDCHVIMYVCSYEEQSGRESIIEMLSLIINKFPEVGKSRNFQLYYLFTLLQEVLKTQSLYLFVPMVTQLVREESPLCRQMMAAVIKTLMKKVGREKRNYMVGMVRDWFRHEKV